MGRELRRGGSFGGSSNSRNYGYSSYYHHSYYYSIVYESSSYVPVAIKLTYSVHYYGSVGLECLPADSECIEEWKAQDTGI